MSIMGNAFDTVSDWAMEGFAVTKILATVTIPVVAGMSILVAAVAMESNRNSDKLKETFSNLDQNPTSIFKSVSDCVQQGYGEKACVSSQETALEISRTIGTRFEYFANQNECVMSHWNCKEADQNTTTTVSDGFTYHAKVYKPKVQAWLVSTDDIQKSVPLYSGSKPGTLARFDGVHYNF